MIEATQADNRGEVEQENVRKLEFNIHFGYNARSLMFWASELFLNYAFSRRNDRLLHVIFVEFGIKELDAVRRKATICRGTD